MLEQNETLRKEHQREIQQMQETWSQEEQERLNSNAGQVSISEEEEEKRKKELNDLHDQGKRAPTTEP